MDHHDVVFDSALAFFNLFFEENQVASGSDVDSPLFITLEFVSLFRFFVSFRGFKREIQDRKCKWHISLGNVNETGREEWAF